MLGTATVVAIVNFNAPNGVARPAYDLAGANWAAWQQFANYRDNGLLAGLFYNMPAAPTVRPAGYDQQVVAATIDELTRQTIADNAQRDLHALDDVNIVLVLSESFNDPQHLGLQTDTDLIPNYRALAQHNPSGQMISTALGGSTANVEFELLTGLSVALLQPQARVPYQNVLPSHDNLNSFIRSYAPGHQPIGLHPFHSWAYNRHHAWPALGISDTTFQEGFTYTDSIGNNPYVSDRAVFDEALMRVEQTDQPVIMHIVTIQGHAPYDGVYDDPVNAATADGTPLRETDRQYLRGLTYSDQALGEFAAKLNDLPEKTVVLYYGDHRSPTWAHAMPKIEGDVQQRLTPYVIFANFPLAEVPDTGAVGPAHLFGKVVQAVNGPEVPMMVFLDQIRPEVPQLLGSWVMLPSGSVELDDLPPSTKAKVDQYSDLQYTALIDPDLAATLYRVPTGSSP